MTELNEVDDFEELCKDLEDENYNSKIVSNENIDSTENVIDQIDSYLQDGSNDGVEVDDQNNIPPKECSINEKLTQFTAHRTEVPKHTSTSSGSSAETPTPPSENDKSTKSFCEAETNDEEYDLSLLDKEDWEDEWEEVEEIDITELLKDLKENGDDKALHEEVKKLEDTTETYYQHLEKVWNTYKDQKGVGPIPSRQQMNPPRIFRYKNKIIGYESVQEYVDNNHPLWGPQRNYVGKLSLKNNNNSTNSELRNFVAKDWPEKQLNTSQNLSVFGKNIKRTDMRCQRTHNRSTTDDPRKEPKNKNIKDILVEMYANATDDDSVQQSERERLKLFESQLKNALLEKEKNRVTLNSDTSKGVKRQCTSEPNTISKKQYKNLIITSSHGKNSNEVARSILGVEKAYDLLSSCTNDPYFSKDQVDDISSIDEVQDKILDLYESPYSTTTEGSELSPSSWSKQLIEDY